VTPTAPMDLWTYEPMDLSRESPQRLAFRDAVDFDDLRAAARSGFDADRSVRDVEDFGKERDERVVGGAVDGRRGELDEEHSVADPGDGRSAGARGHADGEKSQLRFGDLQLVEDA
jgi:hypothetical protein